ncbi:MAG: PAS domain S-box protein [Chthoniobacteraceae bacterium]|jgi:PAS domain S-box-containing protein
MTSSTTSHADAIPAHTNYRSIVEHAIEGIFQTTPDGRYLLANPALAAMYGYASVDELKSSVKEIARQLYVDATRRSEFIRLMNENDCVRGFESQIYRKDGSIIWISENVRVIRNPAGEVLYYEGTVEDITKRRQAEEQIEEQAALLDKTQDAITVRDLDDRFLFWNKGAERILGWTRDEAMNAHISGEIPRNDEAYEAVLREGEWSGEFQRAAKDGRKLMLQTRWTLLRDNEGAPKSILAITTDITEKKKIEAQLLRSQRMESIGTLASGIAHDLNNILAPILMSASILHDLVPADSRTLTTAIEESAQRGTDIVKQVLTFARGIEGERVALQPRHLIKEMHEIARETFPRSIQIRSAAPKTLWTVIGDSTQVHQILLNLCINARDAMPDGGTLTITAENLDVNECDAAMHPDAKAGRYVATSVADTGTGISAKIIDKIFDPFFTTKEVGKGTGLGLSTVIGIAKSHGGFVKVYSEPGKGSTFKVYLPASPGEYVESHVKDRPLLPVGNGELVLLADDEPAVRKVTETMLRRNGYNVLVATDGIEALSIYAQRMHEIRIVLTDVMMPLLDGTKLTRALKRMNKDVDIIAATGQADEARQSELKQLGIKSILLKPYRTDKLLGALHEIINC